MSIASENTALQGIAIIGMAGKFPGVENIYEYWENIKLGRELLTRFSKEELQEKGLNEKFLSDVNFVPVSGLVNSAEHFDSSFFGFTAREADLTDPQHRKFLEVCYEALEHSGTSPDKYKGSIGVFAGCSMNNYLIKNLLQYPDLLKSIGEIQSIVNNDKDFLTTKVSYKLNLTGPSFDIQAACSTSLVAIHEACQNLLNYQCDIALGGGVHLMSPRGEGYIYNPGGIESPDGKCRPFDKDAKGTIFSEGIGVVVLKRLEDAIEDKDEIWAVIKSTAINNDGFVKVGYMAPSINGQSEVISLAQNFAEIDPRTISYVEAHGTGTNLGDPIEIAALTKVFRKYTNDTNFCAIGSVKGNIGHCDVAAGVAGLIKAVMALKYKTLPPSINFNKPNPELNIEKSPFYINTGIKEWDSEKYPRRAAVSSFGFGGTNAHCILEEWNVSQSEPSIKEIHLLPLSAKSSEALNHMIGNLSNFLHTSSNDLADIAYTLQNGRNDYSYRALIYGENRQSTIDAILNKNKDNIVSGKLKFDNSPVIFMFTGQGSQYVNMSKGLYDSFELFRNIVDEAHQILDTKFNIQLKSLLFADPEDEKNRAKINLTSNTQPLLFVIQYATACLLTDFGIYPKALIGHSIGELTAATFSGVFSFEDALCIVASRGKIMQEQISGSMLAVNLSVDKLLPLLSPNIEISLQNAPNYSVVSGRDEDVVLFETKLKSINPAIHTTKLKTSHAFHSYLMEPALEPFRNVLKDFTFEKPEIPLISNVTGSWITDDQATSVDYWSQHIRSTVYFSKGVNQLLRDLKNPIFLEVGPGNSLSVLLSQFEEMKNAKTISTIRHPMTQKEDVSVLMQAIGEYWVNGGKIRWEELYTEENRYKIPLPTYPFERKRHWLDSRINNIFHQTNDGNISVHELNLDSSAKDKTSLMHDRPNLATKYVEPANDLEKKIVEIWQQLLGFKEIGTEDNFFALGGHSLLASQVIIRISENLKVQLPFESIFKSPTVKSLISNYNLSLPSKTEKIEIEHVQDSLEFPLSKAQQRLWILNQIEQYNPAYNIPFTFRLTGSLDYDIFQKALQILFDRHKILKSIINLKDNNPICCILNIEPKIELVDFTKILNKDPEIQDFLKNEIRKPFDIEVGPLYRIYLIQISNNEHIFHLNIHHIIFDGWSWGVFTHELNEIYNSLKSNTHSSLDAPDLQYFDFSNWQDKQSEEVQKNTIDFWVKQLKDAPIELKFPYDYKRPQLMSGFGGRESIIINKELSDKLKDICKKANSTLFMTLLTSFEILMSIYSGEDDVCIGSPVANRTKSVFEKIIGFFVNTIVFRLKIDKNLSFNEILDQNKKVIIESLEYQNIPFEKLVEVIQPERQVNLNPIYQVMFAWQNAPRPPIKLNGIDSDRVIINEGVSPQDITFYMWENEGFIEGDIEFNTDIIERETIIRLKDNFVFFLEQIIENSEQKILEISIVSEKEKRLLTEFNNTDVPYEHDICIHQKFEQQVRENPNLPALINSSLSISYKDFNDHANRMANFLISQGVKVEDKVAICIDRSVEMMICILGILKAGAAYLPLHPENPAERLKSILDDAKPKLILSNRASSKNIPNGISVISVDDILLNPLSKNSLNPNVNVNSKNLAYVLYTSGSTGMPKGVMIEHHSVLNRLGWMQKAYPIDKTDTLLQKTPITFDVSVWELFWWFFNGAKLVLLPKGGEKDPEELINYIDKYNVTTIHFVPSMFASFIETVAARNLFHKLEKLNRIFLSGEALPLTMVKEFNLKRNSYSLPDIINLYGPTEATVDVSYYNCPNNNIENVYIGKPIDNTKLFVVNKNNVILPIGVPGELLITGVNLARGYLNRPDLTNDKFFNFNISSDQSIRAYHSGDLVKLTNQGQIDYLGRIDNQVKIRGFRIELGDIEAKILEHPMVTNCAVIVEDKGDYKFLVAYVCLKSDEEITVEKLRTYLFGKLPDYMVPSYIVFLKELPLTSSGKINRKNLPKIDKVTEGNTITEPSGKTEKLLLDLWGSLLKVEKISTNDNFFDCGGNSLLAIRLINKIKEQTGVALSFSEFLAYPTIIQSGNYIDSFNESKSETIELLHTTETINLPLTSNQKRLWLISSMEPDIATYIIPFTLKLKGPLNYDIFKKSIDKLFHRHHIVFSVIKEKNGDPYCDIVPSNVDIAIIDYSGLSEDEKSIKTNEVIEADYQKPFNLSKGPLFRLYLIKKAQNDYIFHFSIHHIVFDGWSWSVFAEDLSEIYNNLIQGKEVNLEELEFQEYDYARWENNYAGSESEKKSIKFWKENLKDCSPLLNFPYDFQRKEQPSGKGGFESIRLSKDLTEKLKRIGKTEGASLFTTLFSVFGIQMQKYSGESDLNIGVPVAYRPHSKLENIFGMFVNTIVVRLKYEKGQTFKNLIRQTNEATMSAITHQDLAFDKVVEIVNPERFHNVGPLFQVAFDWHNNLDKPLKLDGITSEAVINKERAAIFDITLNLWEIEGFIEGEIEYNIDILKQETIVRLRDNFITLAENLIENSDYPIESVPMISNEEITMIKRFNDTRTNYPKDKTIIQLFEDQANLYPDKTAVVFKENALTYKQLNEKTNQVARILRENGVKANVPVGIMIDKSVDMIVGILGILKAGGGYVPIDPEYPEQRINFIIKDSGLKILLTQEKYSDLPVEGIEKINLGSEKILHIDKSKIEGINVPSDLAYIIYTSGTTGLPKGSLIPQQGVVRLVRDTNYIDFSADDRVLQTAAIVFDASTEEIFGALLNGATLYIINKETLLDPNAFGDVLSKNNITIVDLASALFTQIAESRTDVFSPVKKLILGGDIVSAPHVNKVRRDNPQLTVINTYGPTENSCNSTAYTLDRDFEYNIPIGKPISNSTAYIFDKNMNYQPIGIIGELYVGGDGLSMGYLNRDDLNRISFIDNPQNPGERLYKTGDLAKWLSDGNIEFHGRIDNQIKIRGFRVELDEIETVISDIEGVIETVIKPIKIAEGDYKLVAFLNVSEASNIDPKEIERVVKAKLPPYMVPSAYKFVHGFKKNVNGKIDRKDLSFDLSELEESKREEIEVLSSTETALITIWSDVLKTKDILAADNFFDIGGNSLLTISLTKKIEDTFNIPFNIRNIFSTPRLKDLAEVINIKVNLESLNKNDDNTSTKILEGEI